jgi:hypothetical protein
LIIRADGSCGLSPEGKDWIMWRRRPDAPASPGQEARVGQAGETDIMSRVARAAMSGVMNAFEREGFPERKVYSFPYPPAADELRALGFFREVGRDSTLVHMELTDEGRRWIMAHRAR